MKRLLEPDSVKEPLTTSIIRINAGGGTILMTTLNTLTKVFPKSVIARQFSRLEMIPRDDDGNYFIDTDPVHFKAILNVLRRPDLVDVVPYGIDESSWWSALDYWAIKPYIIPVKQELPRFGKIMHETAIKLYKCEFEVAKWIVDSMNCSNINPIITTFRYHIQAGFTFVHNDLSGTLIHTRDEKYRGIDTTTHHELVLFVLQNSLHFKMYIEKLLPTHRIELTKIKVAEKDVLIVEIVHIYNKTLFEEICK